MDDWSELRVVWVLPALEEVTPSRDGPTIHEEDAMGRTLARRKPISAEGASRAAFIF
jgi:hypothetical protein